MKEPVRCHFQRFLVIGCAAVLVAACCSVIYGSTRISFQQIINGILSPDSGNHDHLVIRELRIPRTIGCLLVGAAFSTAGAIMQGVTGNPLADAGLLGVNAGATFALALCLAFFPGLGFSGVVLFSFSGAAITLTLVYGLLRLRRGKLNPIRLVLAGSAVGIFLSSLSQTISIFCQIGHDLTFWIAGGAAGIRWEQLMLAGLLILVGLTASIFLSDKVAILSLGEDTARGLGLHVERSRMCCLVLILLLAGSAVALAGPVSFVGLLVPHLARFFIGVDYRHVIPVSMIGGAFCMLVADVISRLINAPSETPVGLIFSVIGVPFFISTIRKGDRTIE